MCRKLLIIFMLSILFSSGCATQAKYDNKLSTWLNVSEATLIAHFGIPNRVYETNGWKYLTYVAQNSVMIPGITPTYITTNYDYFSITNAVGGTPPRVSDYICETTFIIHEDKVYGYNFQGNDCVSW